MKVNVNMHDREIRIDNGWSIKIGRGLYFFQKPDSWFGMGANDISLGRCLETKVDAFKAAGASLLFSTARNPPTILTSLAPYRPLGKSGGSERLAIPLSELEGLVLAERVVTANCFKSMVYIDKLVQGTFERKAFEAGAPRLRRY